MQVEQSDKVNIIFSASSLDLFDLCKARYNYGHNLRKTLPIYQKAPALDFGSAIHEGYEVYYNALKEGEHFNDRIHKTLMKIKSYAADPAISNIDMDELAHLEAVVEQNLTFWRHEDDFMEILAVEAPFDYILFEDEFIRIIISGKIDLLVDMPAIGGRGGYTNLPIDHKSFSRDGIVPSLSNQFINYCIPTKSNFLLVNRIPLHKHAKDREGLAKRLPLSYDPGQIEQWKKDVIFKISNEYLMYVKLGYWPTNFTSCNKYNKLCPYYSICDASGQEAKDWILNSQFVDAEPYDKYGNDEV